MRGKLKEFISSIKVWIDCELEEKDEGEEEEEEDI